MISRDKTKTNEPVLNLRTGTIEDLPIIKKCLVDSWVTHAQHEPTLLDENRMRNSDIQSYYEKGFADPDCIILIAEKNNTFAGFLRCQREEISNFFIYPVILYIDEIYVLKEFRRQGIAKLLIKKAEEIAKSKDIHRIQLRVYAWNKQTISLFKNLGYDVPYITVNKVLNG